MIASFFGNAGFLKTILLVSFVGALAWVYQSIQPPPAKIVGSPGGAAVTSPRIKLRDGRHLAYKESGIPRDEAKFKIIYIHGFDSCMHDSPVAHFLSPVSFPSPTPLVESWLKRKMSNLF